MKIGGTLFLNSKKKTPSLLCIKPKYDKIAFIIEEI